MTSCGDGSSRIGPARAPRITLSAFLHLLPLVILFGCAPDNDGFRFQGEYEAAGSGYRIRILSEGLLDDGTGAPGAAFSIVQICPSGSSTARPVRMTLHSAPGRPIEMEAADMGPIFMEWSPATAEGLIRGLLSAANFRNIPPAELAGTVTVIGRSLEGPGRMPAGDRTGSLRVLRAEVDSGYPVDKDAPPREWISQKEVPGCVR